MHGRRFIYGLHFSDEFQTDSRKCLDYTARQAQSLELRTKCMDKLMVASFTYEDPLAFPYLFNDCLL
ncbi:hypothetical protein BGV49_14425 [Burkholderia ubonensis]|nr:hypothetical protein BGV49_14425 [Burkholderia ubonensis]